MRTSLALIRTERRWEICASATSVYMPVREKLVQLQQELAARENVIMDGRDIGTCVLPDAPVKIYLTASVQVRALRRFKELQGKGIDCSLEEIEKDIRGQRRAGYEPGTFAASPGGRRCFD